MVTFRPTTASKSIESLDDRKSRSKRKRREAPSSPENPASSRTSSPSGVAIAISRFFCVYVTAASVRLLYQRLHANQRRSEHMLNNLDMDGAGASRTPFGP